MQTSKRRSRTGLWIVAYFLLATFAFSGPAVAELADDERLEAALIGLAQRPWKGDLDGMVERGFVRILTVYNPLFFAYDGIEQRGLAVDIAREFEKHLRKELGKPARHLNVMLIVVPRDELIPALLEGRGDIATANLTITPEREELVAFGKPTYPDVSELIVTGPDAPEVVSLDDLVPIGLHIRESSSYFEHLSSLNEQRIKSDEEPIPIDPADERLEDYDLLELLNTGIVPALIVDSHKIAFWSQVFGKIVEGLDVVESLEVGDSILRAQVRDAR